MCTSFVLCAYPYVPADSSIETDFSGTTFTCAVIRGNTIIMGNVGDSRTSLGSRAASGATVGRALTIDHKPDLPAEKVRPACFGSHSVLLCGVVWCIFRSS